MMYIRANKNIYRLLILG